jgi:hypothetical protein
VHLETILLYLMAAEHWEKLVSLEQLLHRLLAEVVGALAVGVVFEFSVDGFLVVHGIGPHQVAENAVQWNLLETVNLVDFVQLVQVLRNSSVHGQVLFGNESSDRKRVEHIHEQVVDLRIVSLNDFVSERERISHVPRLVIAAQHNHTLGLIQFDCKQKQADFDAEDATVYVVT